MIKNHSDKEKKKPAATTLSNLQLVVVFYMCHPTDRIVHTTIFVTPVVEHCWDGWIRRLTAS